MRSRVQLGTKGHGQYHGGNYAKKRKMAGGDWNSFADAFKHGPDHFFSAVKNEFTNPNSDLAQGLTNKDGVFRKDILPVASMVIPELAPLNYASKAAAMLGHGHGHSKHGGNWSQFADAFQHGPDHFFNRAGNEFTNRDSEFRRAVDPVVHEIVDPNSDLRSKYLRQAAQIAAIGGVPGAQELQQVSNFSDQAGRVQKGGSRKRKHGGNFSDFTDAFKHGPDHFFSRAANEFTNRDSDLRRTVDPVVHEIVDPSSDLRSKYLRQAAQIAAIGGVPGAQEMQQVSNFSDQVGRVQSGGAHKRSGRSKINPARVTGKVLLDMYKTVAGHPGEMAKMLRDHHKGKHRH